MYLLLYGRLMAGVEAKMTFSEVASDVVFKVEDGRGHLHATACVWRSGRRPGVSSFPGRVEAGPVLVYFLLYCAPQADWRESFQLIQLFHMNARNSNDKRKLSGLRTSALVPQ